MGISSALYSGVSGLSTNGAAMSVIGNNLANTNTLGFKGSRTVFADLLSSSINGSGGRSQVGRGVGMSKVDQIFSQGTFESTESNLDVAIEGEGFFVLSEPGDATDYYTRAGSFRFDDSGFLVNPEGLRVQGKAYDINGDLAPGDAGDIQVASGGLIPGNATSSLVLTTNLDSTEPAIALPFDYTNPDTYNYTSSVEVFDTLGNPQLLSTYFTKLSDNTWRASWSAEMDDGSGIIMSGTFPSPLEFTSDGVLVNTTTVPPTDTTATIPSFAGTSLATGTTYTLPAGEQAILPNGTEATQPDGTVYTLTDVSTLPDGSLVNLAGGSVESLPAGTIVTQPDGTVTTLPDAAVTEVPAGTTAVLPFGAITTLPDSATITLPSGSVINAPSGRIVAIPDNTVITLPNTSAATLPNGTTLPDGTVLSGGTISTYGDGSAFFQTLGSLNWNNGTTPTDIVITFDTTQLNSESDVISQNQNGYGAGNLTGIDIDGEGTVIASYSNGEQTKVARLVLGKFVNTGGLELAGSNMYRETRSSGPPRTGLPGPELGNVFTNSLEQSTVDMGAEFVKMITVQRGFQANSKIITTVDELLGELINLKR